MKKIQHTIQLPKILAWDVETSYLLAAVFQRFLSSAIPFSSVVQDWFMFCAAVQWLHEKKPRLISILDDPERFDKDFTDSYHVVLELRNLIDEADILIAHNGDHFDWKKFKALLIKYKIKPPRKPILIDTYKESKTAQFTSGKLGDLAIQLDLAHKAHSNSGDWLLATLPYGTYRMGSKKIIVSKETKTAALKRIGKYNLKDIPPLIQLYKRLRPYMTRHPNLNRYILENPGCPVCGSGNKWKEGKRAGIQVYSCKDCGHKYKETTAITARKLTYKS